MGKDDWFRNSSWTPDIEEAFDKRLHRARDKSQLLRIQAGYLTESHPDVALRLLDRYFALGEHFDHAMAYVHRAEAFLALGRVEAAIASYEAALERERIYPKLLTQAFLDFPYLIVTRGLSQLYARALEILAAHQSQLMFPFDRYRAHGIRALILQEQGRAADARASAALALTAASEAQSGFPYHQHVGLVKDAGDEFGIRLEAVVRTSTNA